MFGREGKSIGLTKKKGCVMTAVVNFDKCTGCGTCVDVCPVEAIALNDDSKACVNADECTDCGACADECPSEAITLSD